MSAAKPRSAALTSVGVDCRRGLAGWFVVAAAGYPTSARPVARRWERTQSLSFPNPVFREFTTELRKLNEGMAGDRASQEQIAEHEDLSRRYPSLKTKPPRPRRRAS